MVMVTAVTVAVMIMVAVAAPTMIAAVVAPPMAVMIAVVVVTAAVVTAMAAVMVMMVVVKQVNAQAGQGEGNGAGNRGSRRSGGQQTSGSDQGSQDKVHGREGLKGCREAPAFSATRCLRWLFNRREKIPETGRERVFPVGKAVGASAGLLVGRAVNPGGSAAKPCETGHSAPVWPLHAGAAF